MKITRVTITGADDSVSPRDLTDMTKQYPFVEWGIKLCRERQGMASFPSDSWMRMLAALAETADPMPHICAHLSGGWLEELLTGQDKCPHLRIPMFERIQLDFQGKRHKTDTRAFLAALRTLPKPALRIIFQADGVNDYLHTLALANGLDAQAIFDTSHGNGIIPEKWHRPLPYSTCGYAGGLGPENLAYELRRIAVAAGQAETWVDIQSRVRSEDGKSLDLGKVLACLETAAQFIRKATPGETAHRHPARAKEPRQLKSKAEGREEK